MDATINFFWGKPKNPEIDVKEIGINMAHRTDTRVKILMLVNLTPDFPCNFLQWQPFLCRDVGFLPKLSNHWNASLAVKFPMFLFSLHQKTNCICIIGVGCFCFCLLFWTIFQQFFFNFIFKILLMLMEYRILLKWQGGDINKC